MSRIKYSACLVLSLSFLIYSKISAQSCEEIYNISLPYSIFTTFFKKNPQIKSVHFESKNKNQYYVSLSSSKGKTNILEGYYLEFEGDKYIFDLKYPHLKLDKLPSLDLKVFPANKELGIKYKTNTDVFRDSIKYEIHKACCLNKNNNYYINRLRFSAGYKEDIDSLAKIIQIDFINQKIITVPSDSVVLFYGAVERNGTISEVQLYTNKSTQYTKFIKKELERNYTGWSPLTVSGGKLLRSKMLIYIKLHNNKITLSTRLDAYKRSLGIKTLYAPINHKSTP